MLYAPELLSSDFARGLIEQRAGRGVRCQPATAEVLESLADKENPQGILAVVRQKPWRLDDLAPRNFRWGAAAVAPQYPGNVGAILRTHRTIIVRSGAAAGRQF